MIIFRCTDETLKIKRKLNVLLQLFSKSGVPDVLPENVQDSPKHCDIYSVTWVCYSPSVNITLSNTPEDSSGMSSETLGSTPFVATPEFSAIVYKH